MASQYIRVGDTLTNIIDSKTGESVTYDKVTVYADGTPMDDTKLDPAIYRKLGVEYFRRNFNGIANIKWFGALGGGNDDTIAIQKAFDLLGIVYNNLLFEYDTYNFSQHIILNNKSNIEINFNNATLFDMGKDITVIKGTPPAPVIVNTPVGIEFSNIYNFNILNLIKDQNPGGGGPIQTDQEDQRVPALDFFNCNNLSFTSSELRGPVGPNINNLTLGAAHFMRASYLRFNQCSAVRIKDITIASGCGYGELFSFVDTDYITWTNCYHNQGTSPVTIYSFGKLIDCDWVTISGHNVQTLSPGSFIDFLGNNLVMSDIVFNGHIDSKLIDLTSEWNLPGRVISNVRISDCVSAGRGISSATSSLNVPNYRNIVVSNIKLKDGVFNDATTLMGFESIDDITFNNLVVNNIRSIFTAEISTASRDTYHTYRFNNLIYNLTDKLAANVVIHEANGLTEFRNSVFNINSITTLASIEPRDRHAIYASVTLPSARSTIRYIGCTFNDAKFNFKANTEFIGCTFNNCAFTTNSNTPASFQTFPTLLFRKCDFNYIDDALTSTTLDGNLFFINTLKKLTLQDCKFRGQTTNTNGVSIISFASPSLDGDIYIDNCFFDIVRIISGVPAKYPGIFRIHNQRPAQVLMLSNSIFSQNMSYMVGIDGAGTSLPSGLVTFTSINNKFLSEGNSPIIAAATDVSRVAISLIDDQYSSGLNLGTVSNFASQVIKVAMSSSDASPETLFDAGQGSTFQSSATNGYRFVKQSANSKTGWIQLTVNKIGTTALRPTSRPTGFYYFDTTLLKPIYWSGTNWRDAVGTVV